jgi:formate dehydrogenase subunit delta
LPTLCATVRISQGETRAVSQIADHIRQFWDPRMRRDIAAHIAAGGAGLDPLAKAALSSMATDACGP